MDMQFCFQSIHVKRIQEEKKILVKVIDNHLRCPEFAVFGDDLVHPDLLAMLSEVYREHYFPLP